MKHLIITLFIAAAALSVKAQAPQQPQEKPVVALIPLETLKAILNRTANVITSNKVPWETTAPLLNDIQQIYPMLVEMKSDTAKKVEPKVKPKK